MALSGLDRKISEPRVWAVSREDGFALSPQGCWTSEEGVLLTPGWVSVSRGAQVLPLLMGFLLEVGTPPHLPCSLRTPVTWVTLSRGAPGLVGLGAAATMAGEAVSFSGPLLQPTRDLGTLGGGAGVPTVHRNF